MEMSLDERKARRCWTEIAYKHVGLVVGNLPLVFGAVPTRKAPRSGEVSVVSQPGGD